jgi:hypothetical protein
MRPKDPETMMDYGCYYLGWTFDWAGISGSMHQAGLDGVDGLNF